MNWFALFLTSASPIELGIVAIFCYLSVRFWAQNKQLQILNQALTVTCLALSYFHA